MCCYNVSGKSFFYCLQFFDVKYSLFKIIISSLAISTKVYLESYDLYNLATGLFVLLAVTISLLISYSKNTQSSCYHKMYAFLRFAFLIVILIVNLCKEFLYQFFYQYQQYAVIFYLFNQVLMVLGYILLLMQIMRLYMQDYLMLLYGLLLLPCFCYYNYI